MNSTPEEATSVSIYCNNKVTMVNTNKQSLLHKRISTNKSTQNAESKIQHKGEGEGLILHSHSDIDVFYNLLTYVELHFVFQNPRGQELT